MRARLKSEKSQSEKYREEAQRARVFAEHARTPQERKALLEIEKEFERLAVMRDDMTRKRLSAPPLIARPEGVGDGRRPPQILKRGDRP